MHDVSFHNKTITWKWSIKQMYLSYTEHSEQVRTITDPEPFIFSQQQFHLLMSISLIHLQCFFQLQVLLQTIIFIEEKLCKK